MVDTTDVLEAFSALRAARPVFHSEADFQHALAWEMQRRCESWRVRLETAISLQANPTRRIHLDLHIRDPRDGTSVAVELKYPTAELEVDDEHEEYRLASQGAQDLIRYDVLKDIGRIEQLVSEGKATSGIAILLTNDPLYWQAPKHGRPTNADAFRLHQGLTISGCLDWGPATGDGTKSRERNAAIELHGTYLLDWKDYSRLDGDRGRFRYLTALVQEPGQA
ncbi:hypothetical protein [Brachybacterium muris]|uniref:Restriction endonuclease n=1 Tax=Brachybacterium muris UCD-AY4 TaxID=1249481 RepID=A0A022KWK8_9MICO|nr:hypothetical protein [Brachybacterium muris]EYT49293.1 hypothetical protein D641_0107570 [Brachybacterium muris UCD-AY4]